MAAHGRRQRLDEPPFGVVFLLWVNDRIWTPPHLQTNCLLVFKIDCARIFGLLSWHALMPGHNGLFAR